MYRIVITKEEPKTVTKQVWNQLFATPEEAAVAGEKSTHGYVDKREEVVQETQLLDQRVEDLDLKAVIKAVNNMEEKPDGGKAEPDRA